LDYPTPWSFGCQEGTRIGRLVRFIPISFIGNNRVDAAFVSSSASLVSNSIFGIGAPVGSARNPRLNEFVKKSGRTTGVTVGVVSAINATVEVDYESCGGIPLFVGQAIVEAADSFPSYAAVIQDVRL
jgi:hypothetical protein